MKRRFMTAAEFVAQLEADPEYQARMRKREAELAPVWELRRQDEISLVQELREAGLHVGSVYDFVNTAEEYREALPILVRHLGLPHERIIREGIVRALTIKYGGTEVEEVLLREFKIESDVLIRWTLANALKVAMPYSRRKKHPEIEAAYRGGSSSKKKPNQTPEPTRFARGSS